MKRSMIAGGLVMALVLGACRGGDKTPASTAAPTRTSNAEIPASIKTPVPNASVSNEKTISGLFGSIFNGALNGPSGELPTALGPGDPELAKLLPPDSAFPDGYKPVGQYAFRAPDGISQSGGIDIAAETAVKGDPSASTPDFSNIGVLMALVLKPDDLQSLGQALDSIKDLDQQSLEQTLAQGTGVDGLFKFENVRVFQTAGLGEGNVGMEMTIDLGGFGSIFGGLAGDATPAPGAPDLSSLKLTMRLYLFARGDYAGGLLRMAFANSLPDNVDETGLAKLIDDNLKAAP